MQGDQNTQKPLNSKFAPALMTRVDFLSQMIVFKTWQLRELWQI